MHESLAPGAVLEDRHRLLALVGEGGYGSVWRALDPQTGRPVAVKFLKPGRRKERESRVRFARECEILRRLRHPNLARWVSDQAGGARPHLVMEWIDGVSLATLLLRAAQRQRRIPLARVAAWASDLVRGLSHAHAAGVVHCDLKPANVVQSPRGLVIVDFGSARLHRRIDWLSDRRVIGTTSYLTPEQLRSEPATWASDQFALATVLFEALTLRRAWFVDADGAPLPMNAPRPALAANESSAVFSRIQLADRPSVRSLRLDVSAQVDDVLRRAWEPDPAGRFSSMHAFLDAFRDALLGTEMPEEGSLVRSEAPTLLSLRPSHPRASCARPRVQVSRPDRRRRGIARASIGRLGCVAAGAAAGIGLACWLAVATWDPTEIERSTRVPVEPRATPQLSLRPPSRHPVGQPLSLDVQPVTLGGCDGPRSDCGPSAP